MSQFFIYFLISKRVIFKTFITHINNLSIVNADLEIPTIGISHSYSLRISEDDSNEALHRCIRTAIIKVIQTSFYLQPTAMTS